LQFIDQKQDQAERSAQRYGEQEIKPAKERMIFSWSISQYLVDNDTVQQQPDTIYDGMDPHAGIHYGENEFPGEIAAERH